MSGNWGTPLWRVEFTPQARAWPAQADVVVVGGGLAGLAVAAWVQRRRPDWRVVLLEAERVGAGASGRTGGLVLPETAAGDLPQLGDVLNGFQQVLSALAVECELQLPGVYEIGRSGGRDDSPIRWEDAGLVRVVGEVKGGAVNPGKLMSQLARAAERLGVHLFEQTRVEAIGFGPRPRLRTGRGELETRYVVLATNAQAAALGGLDAHYRRTFTLAVATAPLPESVIEQIGLQERKPFYTVDLPYLWGRLTTDNRLVAGSGLVDCPDESTLAELDVETGEVAAKLKTLENRLHRLHPALCEVEITHRWGGPMLFRPSQIPVLSWHRECSQAVVINGLGGHGVALAVHLGRWAAEMLCDSRQPPSWGSPD